MAPRFVTLADLYREGCNLLVQCKSCGKWSEKTVYDLSGQGWEPGKTPTDLDQTTIAAVLARMKCSRCGKRDVEWWPKRSAPWG